MAHNYTQILQIEYKRVERIKRNNLHILIFESLGVLRLLSYPASHPNHTSYRKFYFNEFVANVLPDNMCKIIFEFRGCGGCQMPKKDRTLWHFNSTFSSSYSASFAYQKKQKQHKCSPMRLAIAFSLSNWLKRLFSDNQLMQLRFEAY